MNNVTHLINPVIGGGGGRRMSRKHLKPRDKVTQRMTRDGVVLENQTTGEEINMWSCTTARTI